MKEYNRGGDGTPPPGAVKQNVVRERMGAVR